MPKKYEDEIREILKGMDDVPGDGPPRRPTPIRPRMRMPSLGMSGMQLDPQRLMGGALILMLFAWAMRLIENPSVIRWAGYVSLAGTALFIVAIVMYLRNRGSLGSFSRPDQKRWRGQVIYLPGSEPWTLRLRRSVSRLFGRGQRGGTGTGKGRRGRDSYQW
jgi:hypothetical protein